MKNDGLLKSIVFLTSILMLNLVMSVSVLFGYKDIFAMFILFVADTLTFYNMLKALLETAKK